MRVHILAALIAATGLAGCGGGAPSHRAQTGAAVFTIVWPKRSKLIPMAANSIAITINGSGYSAGKTLPRPTQGDQTSTTFDNIPVLDLIATAIAYPNNNG